MTMREPNEHEEWIAADICLNRSSRRPNHMFRLTGCPDCRAFVVQLVDGRFPGTKLEETIEDLIGAAYDHGYQRRARRMGEYTEEEREARSALLALLGPAGGAANPEGEVEVHPDTKRLDRLIRRLRGRGLMVTSRKEIDRLGDSW